MFSRFIYLLILLFTFIFSETLLVPEDYSTIQSAISASSNDDLILISAGIYNENNFVFYDKSITIKGEDPNTTIINGGGNARGFYSDNPFGTWIAIHNLTITNFNSDSGSAFYLSGGQASINNCIISNNTAENSIIHIDDGNTGSSNLQITKTLISDNNVTNQSNSYGAIVTYDNVNLTLDHVTVVNNLRSGLFSNESTSNHVITNSIFYNPNAEEEIGRRAGGAMMNISYTLIGSDLLGCIDSDEYLCSELIIEDPLFNSDYTLQAESPCIDAGTGTDDDGSIADLGMYAFIPCLDEFTCNDNDSYCDYSCYDNGEYSLAFDGIDYIAGSTSTLDVSNSNQITIGAFVNPSAYTHSLILQHSSPEGGGQSQYALQLDEDGKVYFTTAGGAQANGSFEQDQQNRSNSSIPLNAWSHIALTYNNQSIKIFINGILDFEHEIIDNFPTDYDGSSIIGNFYIGMMANGSIPFLGKIDEIAVWDNALNFDQIYDLANGEYNHDTGSGDPIAIWNFNQGEGNDLIDFSGNKNHGTIYGADWIYELVCNDPLAYNYLSSEECKYQKYGDYALKFDDEFDYVNIGRPLSIYSDNNATYSVWINTTADDDDYFTGGNGIEAGFIISNDTQPTNPQMNLFMNTDGTSGLQGEGYTCYSNIVINDGKWHHLVATKDGGTLTLYVDNEFGCSASGQSNLDQGNDFFIGGHREGGDDRTFKGLISNVKLINRDISPTEIEILYNGGNVDNTVADFRFDEITENILLDNSSGNNGQFYGTPTWVEHVDGCIDELACNYNPEANNNDNSCQYPNECFDGSFECNEDDCFYVEVTYPNGGEIWEAGETYTITWEGGFTHTGVGLSQNGTYFNIMGDVGSDNSYTWSIPEDFELGDDYQVRVYDATAYVPEPMDLSDNTFSIVNLGCIDELANNFNSNANINDNSCTYDYKWINGQDLSFHNILYTGDYYWFDDTKTWHGNDGSDSIAGIIEFSNKFENDIPTIDGDSNPNYLGYFQGSHYFQTSVSADYHTISLLAENNGAHLVVITTQEEQDFIAANHETHSWMGLLHLNDYQMISGCNDQIASNFDNNAIIDDGTCTYDAAQNYWLTFDGSGGSVVNISDLIIDPTEAITFSLDFKLENYIHQSNHNHIFDLEGGNMRYSLVIGTDYIEMRFEGYSISFDFDTSSLDNQWHNIIVQGTSNSMNILLDGNLMVSETWDEPTVEHGLYPSSYGNFIGGNDLNNNYGYYIKGDLDNFIISNNLLSYSDIQNSNFNNSLVAHYKFDSGSGNILVDHSGNQNHGIINQPDWSSDAFLGCIDELACNYDENANTNDGSCSYNDLCGECDGDNSTCSILNDIDGNQYGTIAIGDQVWMKQNLKVSNFNNGETIPNDFSENEWSNLYDTPGYSVYNDDSSNAEIFGYLYNWWAATDERGVCPDGTRLPNEDDWNTLIEYLGGVDVAGGKLKSSSNLWLDPNIGMIDESGFSALPAGWRHSNEGLDYEYINEYAVFWTSEDYGNDINARHYILMNSEENILPWHNGKRFGSSIRCIESILGCTDPMADNYNSEADFDDGSCYGSIVNNEDFTYSGELNGNYYYLSNNLMNWHDAVSISQESNGHLVTITSEEENNFVSAISNYENIYIGLTDENQEGVWEWITGEPFSFSNWVDGEPNDGNSDSAVEDWVHTNYSGNGDWNDDSGDSDFFAVLEITSGCTDQLACNYQSYANIDDGSCQYPSECFDGSYECTEDECLFVELIYPNGGENLVIGETYKIEWNGGFTHTGLNLAKNGIDTGGPSDINGDVDGDLGEYYWTIPTHIEPGSDYQVRIYDATGYEPEPMDYSDNYFSIVSAGCTDVLACNYNYDAGVDDGSCAYPEYDYVNCDGECFNDADNDNICDQIDDCPYDSFNDIDNDGICGDLDDCPYDSENDIDQDGICGDIDECPYDYENDIDNDGLCCNNRFRLNEELIWSGTLNFTSESEIQTPELIIGEDYYLVISGTYAVASNGHQADAAYEFGNNNPPQEYMAWQWNGEGNIRPEPNLYNETHVYQYPFVGTGNVESFFFTDVGGFGDNSGSLYIELWKSIITNDICCNDQNNDQDNDGVCGDVDVCPNDQYNDIDGDGICDCNIDNTDNCSGEIDECPNDPNNDLDNDGVCDDIDDCVGEYDECGICNGKNTDKDCNGDCFGEAFLDDCGICSSGETGNKPNFDKDCNDDCFGDAFVDDCGICSSGETGNKPNFDKDCNGDCYGEAFIDDCGICSSGETGNKPNFDKDCNGDCYGEAFIDDCGVCSAGNSNHEPNSDQDCNGDCFGDAFLDDCDICSDGDSGVIPNSDLDDCGVCFGNNTDLDCYGDCFGEAFIDNCGICSDGNTEHIPNSDDLGCGCFIDAPEIYCLDTDGDGLGNPGTENLFCPDEIVEFWVVDCSDSEPNCYFNEYDCGGECGGDAIIDDCGVCNNADNMNDEKDCNGDCYGEAYLDDCGVCSAGNSNHEPNSDQDCNGDCFGDAFLDDCDICSGGYSGHISNSDKDCNNDCFGDAYIDDCNICSDGNSGHEADADKDCNGDCFGDAIVDDCGNCGGGNTGFEINGDKDCNGDCFGDAYLDNCSICSDGNSGHIPNSDQDCNGDCFGNANIDDCGICGGDGVDLDQDGICDNIDECIGEYDDCGVCNGLNADLDDCGVCFGNNTDQDCYGDCFGDAIIDDCGICGGGNTGLEINADKDCNGDCYGEAFLDDCDVCSGGDSNHEANTDKDCNGDCFGDASIDSCDYCTLGNSGLEYDFAKDDCGVCFGDNLDKDCSGECFGEAIIDDCGICDGDNIAKDCAGICFGDAIIDDCDVCSGGNTNLEINADKDCTGECFGEAIINECDICVGGTTDLPEDYAKDCNGDCFGQAFVDDCGVCSGGDSGVIPNSDLDDCGECFGNNEDKDCNGDCNGDAIIDDCGVCSDGNTGIVPNSDKDVCGECFGDGTSCIGCTDQTACNYDNSATIDDGTCEFESCIFFAGYAGLNTNIGNGLSSGPFYECEYDPDAQAYINIETPEEACNSAFNFVGVDSSDWTAYQCGNVGQWDLYECFVKDYSTNLISIGSVTSESIEILYSTSQPIGGFEFSISGVEILDTEGGVEDQFDYSIFVGANNIIGISLQNNSIPVGAGVLTNLFYESNNSNNDICIEDLTVSDTEGLNEINFATGECSTCIDADNDNICDDIDDCIGQYDDCGVCNGGNQDQDCSGDCFGDAYIDDCGVCDGFNQDQDCAGECFGEAIINECDICVGGTTNLPEDYAIDCNGDCFGQAFVDDCGVCSDGNTGIVPDSDKDCTGECFGEAIIDDCGICDGDNIAKDCAGICFGDAIIDDCDVCSGGNTNLEINADKDCTGDCFGDAIIDECGLCEGPGYDFEGNANNDCNLNVLDVIILVNLVISSGTIDYDADLNNDGIVNVLDIVNLVNRITDTISRASDATNANLLKTDQSLTLKANGYVGGVQMSIAHDSGFEIELTDLALVAEYYTSDNMTNLIIIEPSDNLLFTTSSSYDIIDIMVVNSDQEIDVDISSDFSLSHAYPNPFNPSTTVSLTVPMASHVSVKVYNLMGQVVGILSEGLLKPNVYTFTWNAGDMSSGVYIIKAESSEGFDVQKVLLVK